MPFTECCCSFDETNLTTAIGVENCNIYCETIALNEMMVRKITRRLQPFLLAAEKRTFAKVGRELDMTPAGVTRAIAVLEAELGVKLFVRTTRQVSLTTYGRSLPRKSSLR